MALSGLVCSPVLPYANVGIRFIYRGCVLVYGCGALQGALPGPAMADMSSRKMGFAVHRKSRIREALNQTPATYRIA